MVSWMIFQVIVNDFRERIELYNGELVQVKACYYRIECWKYQSWFLNNVDVLPLQMLIEKDELQQEQEGVNIDQIQIKIKILIKYK